MFDIGWGELVVIGIVALIAIGPKELPSVLRTLGQWMGKVRRMASEFQGQFQEAMREAEMADLKKQFDEASSAASNLTAGLSDPLENARKEMESVLGEQPASSATPKAQNDVPPSPASAKDSAPPIVDVPPPEAAPHLTDSDILPAASKPSEPKREGSGSP
jgi:sec-independent protein translocase protein TatB